MSNNRIIAVSSAKCFAFSLVMNVLGVWQMKDSRSLSCLFSRKVDGFLSGQFDQAQLIQCPDHIIRWIDLMPSYTSKIGPGSVFMVIVVITLSHHQEIHRQEVSGGITYLKVAISIFMGKPIDNGAMYRRQHKLYGQ